MIASYVAPDQVQQGGWKRRSRGLSLQSGKTNGRELACERIDRWAWIVVGRACIFYSWVSNLGHRARLGILPESSQ